MNGSGGENNGKKSVKFLTKRASPGTDFNVSSIERKLKIPRVIRFNRFKPVRNYRASVSFGLVYACELFPLVVFQRIQTMDSRAFLAEICAMRHNSDLTVIYDDR